MKLARVLAVSSIIGLAGSLYGCGSDGNAGTGSTSFGGPNGGSASSLIDALCTGLHGCCVASGKASSKDACVAFYKAFTQNAKLGPTAGACESYLRTHANDGVLCTDGLDGPDDICDDALILNDKGTTPKRALGETCDTEDDCAAATAGAEADCQTTFDGGSSKSTCVEIVTAQAGAACGYSETVDGNRVQVFGGSSKPDDPPVYSLGICKYKEGLYCDGSSKTCKVLGNVGDACTGFDSCVKEASCQFEQGSSKQVCVARAAIGEACNNASSQSCVEGAACKEKVCVALKKAGEACALSSECASSYCNNSKCEGNGGGSSTICFTAN